MLMLDLANEDVDGEIITNVFDIEKYFKNAFIILEDMVEEAAINKSNVVVWRNESAM